MKNKYKLELKKIEHSPKLSEETNAFYAELWVNNEKVAYCKNEGHGGDTFINAFKEKEELLKEVIQWAKTLPPVIYDSFSLENDLELMVNDLLDEYLFQKKIKRLCKKNIVFTIGDDKTKIAYFPLKIDGYLRSIEEIIQLETGRIFIKKLCDKAKKENGTIHNTNIPEEWK